MDPGSTGKPRQSTDSKNTINFVHVAATPRNSTLRGCREETVCRNDTGLQTGTRDTGRYCRRMGAVIALRESLFSVGSSPGRGPSQWRGRKYFALFLSVPFSETPFLP